MIPNLIMPVLFVFGLWHIYLLIRLKEMTMLCDMILTENHNLVEGIAFYQTYGDISDEAKDGDTNIIFENDTVAIVKSNFLTAEDFEERICFKEIDNKLLN